MYLYLLVICDVYQANSKANRPTFIKIKDDVHLWNKTIQLSQYWIYKLELIDLISYLPSSLSPIYIKGRFITNVIIVQHHWTIIQVILYTTLFSHSKQCFTVYLFMCIQSLFSIHIY